MEPKKNPKVNLENKRGLFLQIGLVVSLLSVLIAIEWKSFDKTNYDLGQLNLDDLEEEIIPITKQQEIKPPPPPPPPPEIIEIVEDDVIIEDTLEIEDTETDEDEMIEEIEEEDDEIFIVVENMPLFPGCSDESCTQSNILKHISKNFRYPPMLKDYGIEGRVIATFVINKKGKASDVQILRGLQGGEKIDDEVIRVIKSLPSFTPGRQRNKPASVRYTVPISVQLQ